MDIRVMLLEEAQTPATYEDATYWVARFVNHFPPRSPEQHAVIIADVAASCERNAITVVALCTAMIELMEQATTSMPFLPPSGEIISRAKRKSELFASCLEADRKAIAKRDINMLSVNHGKETHETTA